MYEENYGYEYNGNDANGSDYGAYNSASGSDYGAYNSQGHDYGENSGSGGASAGSGFSGGSTGSDFGGAGAGSSFGGAGVSGASSTPGGAGEDELLSQIDAFRDKAKELQDLISERERKVNELGSGQGGMAPSVDMTREFDRMSESINASLSGIVQRLNQQGQTLAGIENRIGAQDNMLTGIETRLGTQDGALSGIESKIDSFEGGSGEGADTASLKEEIAELNRSVEKVISDLDTMKNEISEKIHSENVKVYRNLNDVIKEGNGGEDDKNEILKKIKGAKGTASWAFTFALLDFMGIAGIIVLMLRLVGII